VSVQEYKCPSCGGALAFDSKEQQMKCPYCDSVFDVEAVRAFNDALEQEPKDHYGWETYDQSTGSGDWKSSELDSMIAYSCPSCGGEIVADKNTAATSCPYCGNHAIISQKLTGMLRPDYVIPFKLDKKAAQEALAGFYKGKPLLPKSFAGQNRIEEITGIYVPFWLFDCATHAGIQYKATRVHHWSDSKYDYTKTDTYQIFREGGMKFEKVPVDGSRKMEDTYMEAIEPYDYNAAVEFQSAYLSGYLADKYDVDAESAKPRANARIKQSVEKAFAATVTGYATCVPEHVRVAFSDGSVRYALMPVWMLNTKYKDKIYTFAMNGQTGKLIGSLPVSWGKFWAWFIGIFVGASALGFLIQSLL
jgi:DNA-directed RNA polymerase subunit RPC12/RpoP